jgi:hypothetical protein
MNYKGRIKKSFDYEKIKSEIAENIERASGFWSDVCILWAPELGFRGNGWSSVGYPLKDEYKAEAMTNKVCYLGLRTEKGFFSRKKKFYGYVQYTYFKEQELCEPVVEYFNVNSNAVTQNGTRYFDFNTYEELETFLKGLETVINETCDGYLYFDEDEAMENGHIKKDAFFLVAYENELVEYDNKLRMAQETQDRQQIDLTEMIEDLKKKINDTKTRLTELKQTE